jgi:hypothetical protein
MKRFVVRYKVKRECAAENEVLIRKVFEELHQKAPAGVSYRHSRPASASDAKSARYLPTSRPTLSDPTARPPHANL